MVKIKRLRVALKVWNKNIFGDVNDGIAQWRSSLEDIQLRIAEEVYSDSLFDEEVAAQVQLGTLLSRKSSLLQQKSCVRWLNDGERNTSFFHNSFKMRRKKLVLSQLKIDGVDSFDRDVIVAHIVDFFSNLFSKTHPPTVSIHDIQHIVPVTVTVTDQHNASLTSIPVDEEIKAAVFDLVGDSAAGSDGFSGVFFQKCWDTISCNIIYAVRAFFVKNYLPQGLNSNTLILIPKKEVVESLTDLRPIILSNFFFKILSKILATRLSFVDAECVSHNQFGFIRGQLIHDCILLGSEGVNYMKCSCQGKNMASKVDIKKAFDTMSWNFIRQGDPLSPVIFGIAEDMLSHLILTVVAASTIDPMRMNRHHLFPTHLLYANDILIFCKVSMKNARTIQDILQCYGFLSGQLCSREKSIIFFAKGVSLYYRRQISRVLGFAICSLPTTDLGVPLFVGRPRSINLAAIKDRIISKFSRYNGRQLSMAGQICLELDAACRNFIWSGDIRKRPSHSASWDRVCGIKEEGGLGIRSFDMMNDPFLMKLAWRIISGRQFGFDIMKSRYLDNFGRPRTTTLASSVWGGVRQLIPELIEESYCLLGNGSSVYFWNDDWLGYSIADKLNIMGFVRTRLKQTVADYLYDGVWHFAQDFIDEFPLIVCDILLLPIGSEDDIRLWKPSVHGKDTSVLAFASRCHRFSRVSWGLWLWENFIPVRRYITCWRFGQEAGMYSTDIHGFLVFAWTIKPSSHLKNLWKLGANTAGSAVRAPGRICAGGVFRDWRGLVRGCFHVEGGIGFAFEAELLGIILAIEFASGCGWNKISFEADSSYGY
ncbi:uncharacterized protein LOC131006461 [Salvia miltiorrhiza]|uniref:uncharacterized protein LOC131006461 n=1 Tax=Salvia miltiorrhiza TaxID=226208 RepID=UPI0025AC6F62|nr:uncharacterized protein LOC131006461 [Salvia miltiorrhiza]